MLIQENIGLTVKKPPKDELLNNFLTMKQTNKIYETLNAFES